MGLSPSSADLFFSKNDPHDPRLGEFSRPSSMEELSSLPSGWVLVGYPDDEGIQLNGGRQGASAGPREIRRALYKMSLKSGQDPIYDIGDLVSTVDLPARHDEARTIMLQCLQRGHRVISLGGGHDYGFPDARGFLDDCQKRGAERPWVLNFDAHLDVRPFDSGFNSGTPFRRLVDSAPGEFEMMQLGIQTHCNSEKHLRWALDAGMRVVPIENLQKTSLAETLQSKGPSNRAPCFLSLDIDVFCQQEAPGCSQSWVTGLRSWDFLESLPRLQRTADIRAMGVYEVSPPLDIDHRTSKLAALCIYHLIQSKV